MSTARSMKRPADMSAEDYSFGTSEESWDFVQGVVAQLLSHPSEVVKKAAADALSQAKQKQRKGDPEALKVLLGRSWSFDVGGFSMSCLIAQEAKLP